MIGKLGKFDELFTTQWWDLLKLTLTTESQRPAGYKLSPPRVAQSRPVDSK